MDIVERLRNLYVQDGTNYVQEAAAEIERLRSSLQIAKENEQATHEANKRMAKNLFATIEAKQAKIDELMLEYCPGEMASGQMEAWAKRQRRVSHEVRDQIESALQSMTENAEELGLYDDRN